MAPPAFVDCHAHAVPSGDDGAQDLDEARWLCRDAAEHGTHILFATPHVWPQLTLSDERERRVRAAFEELRRDAPLHFRLGFELTPSHALAREDLSRYVLQGTDCVLVEVPFSGPATPLFAVLDRVEEQGLRAVIAHPERAEAVQDDPSLLAELAASGGLLQVNATSLLGRHGEIAESLGWTLLEDGRAALVASDAHRPTRPARLDDVFALALARVGEEAERLFTGEALGLSTRPTPSRAGLPAA
jgi:protein-tyrosine phosphatase